MSALVIEPLAENDASKNKTCANCASVRVMPAEIAASRDTINASRALLTEILALKFASIGIPKARFASVSENSAELVV